MSKGKKKKHTAERSKRRQERRMKKLGLV